MRLFKRGPTINGLHENVIMRLYQTRNDSESKSGNKAIIERISDKPVKLVFEESSMKKLVLEDSDNIFSYAYLVDVDVQTVEGVPRLYKVINIHDKLDLD
jgi:hypothetical protein